MKSIDKMRCATTGNKLVLLALRLMLVLGAISSSEAFISSNASPVRGYSSYFKGSCTELTGVCHHHCVAIDKSHYKCSCRRGYELLPNQRSCWRGHVTFNSRLRIGHKTSQTHAKLHKNRFIKHPNVPSSSKDSSVQLGKRPKSLNIYSKFPNSLGRSHHRSLNKDRKHINLPNRRLSTTRRPHNGNSKNLNFMKKAFHKSGHTTLKSPSRLPNSKESNAKRKNEEKVDEKVLEKCNYGITSLVKPKTSANCRSGRQRLLAYRAALKRRRMQKKQKSNKLSEAEKPRDKDSMLQSDQAVSSIGEHEVKEVQGNQRSFVTFGDKGQFKPERLVQDHEKVKFKHGAKESLNSENSRGTQAGNSTTKPRQSKKGNDFVRPDTVQNPFNSLDSPKENLEENLAEHGNQSKSNMKRVIKFAPRPKRIEAERLIDRFSNTGGIKERQIVPKYHPGPGKPEADSSTKDVDASSADDAKSEYNIDKVRKKTDSPDARTRKGRLTDDKISNQGSKGNGNNGFSRKMIISRETNTQRGDDTNRHFNENVSYTNVGKSANIDNTTHTERKENDQDQSKGINMTTKEMEHTVNVSSDHTIRNGLKSKYSDGQETSVVSRREKDDKGSSGNKKPNKLYLRQKMLSSMREQFLDPRLASLLKAARSHRRKRKDQGTTAIPTSTTASSAASYSNKMYVAGSKLKSLFGVGLDMESQGTRHSARSTIPTALSPNRTLPTTSNSGQTLPTTSNSGQTLPTTSNSGQTLPTTSNSGQTLPTTSNLGQTLPTTSNLGQTLPTTSNLGQTLPTTSNLGQTLPTTSNLGQTLPTTSNLGQTLPTTSSLGQTLPTTSSLGQTLPATSSLGQTLPTTSNLGQTLPTTSSTISYPKEKILSTEPKLDTTVSVEGSSMERITATQIYTTSDISLKTFRSLERRKLKGQKYMTIATHTENKKLPAKYWHNKNLFNDNTSGNDGPVSVLNTRPTTSERVTMGRQGIRESEVNPARPEHSAWLNGDKRPAYTSSSELRLSPSNSMRSDWVSQSPEENSFSKRGPLVDLAVNFRSLSHLSSSSNSKERKLPTAYNPKPEDRSVFPTPDLKIAPTEQLTNIDGEHVYSSRSKHGRITHLPRPQNLLQMVRQSQSDGSKREARLPHSLPLPVSAQSDNSPADDKNQGSKTARYRKFCPNGMVLVERPTSGQQSSYQCQYLDITEERDRDKVEVDIKVDKSIMEVKETRTSPNQTHKTTVTPTVANSPTTETVTSQTVGTRKDVMKKMSSSADDLKPFGHSQPRQNSFKFSKTICGPGQTIINSPTGKRCGFQPGISRGAVRVPECGPLEILVDSEQGFHCVKLENVPEEQNPCPTGQKLQQKGGYFQCTYKDDVKMGVKPNMDGGCSGKGEIPVQTSAGFFCQQIEETKLGLPDCPSGEVFVKTLTGFECIRKKDSNLVCPEDQRLVRHALGFRCTKTTEDSATPIQSSVYSSSETCRKGEVLLTEGAVSSCRPLKENADLCGAGFKPRPTELDGSFVCAPEVMTALKCPEGFYLSTKESVCLPVSPHASLCDDVGFKALFGNQVNCSSRNFTAILVPCEEGYELEQSADSLERADTENKICRLVDYVDFVCEKDMDQGASSCSTLPHKPCGEGDSAASSRCLDLLRKVWSGCQPQCANGGVCKDNVCICPPGVAGRACEIDINECELLDKDLLCQHGCINTFGSFRCECPFGSTLNSDGRTCKAISCMPECMNGGVCRDGRCMCPAGLKGELCQTDIDECEKGNHICQGRCRNTFGSFQCVCPPGFKLEHDRRSCANISCSVKCLNGGWCENRKCSCPDGYYGIACQLDVNECLKENHNCSHKCVNTRGSYSCSCPSGSTLLADGKSCSDGTGPSQSRRQTASTISL